MVQTRSSKNVAAKTQGSKVSKVPATPKNTATKKNAKPISKKTETDDFEEFPSSSEGEDEEEFKGFDSTDDEKDDNNKEESDNSDSEEEEATPRKNQLTEQEIKDKASAAASQTKGQKGVVYVGRIPHGFFENEMQSYFSQFGTITRLRLSRNRKTGKSKHYAFIEFEDAEIAKVVADTMDNYLLFGHILKVKLVPQEQVHEKMFLGANRRFKVVPWNEIQRENTERKRSQKEWDDKQKQEEERRKSRMDRLASMGIEFSY